MFELFNYVCLAFRHLSILFFPFAVTFKALGRRHASSLFGSTRVKLPEFFEAAWRKLRLPSWLHYEAVFRGGGIHEVRQYAILPRPFIGLNFTLMYCQFPP